MTKDAETRVREALSRGAAPEPGDVAEVLNTLNQTRSQAEERWEAIARLAPAAKQHRATREAQERVLHALGQHLAELERRLAEDPAKSDTGGFDRDLLWQWLERAQELLRRA